ncbi:MAG: hypothetical protein CMP39_02335 [Rickettsiales bacterium]|nr:hypothetical protein [Rickettsiales bacterium]|tara:strand:+ start:856 stop:1803 length:948 start_codon:yes stop_codon:yes gene_type:complete
MSIVIDQEKIKEHIIHRYENILLDRILVEELDNGKGDLELCITDNDPLGRDIFLTERKFKEKVIMTPIFMEIMALAAITCSGKVEEGQVVFFTGISQFEKFSELPVGQTNKGFVEKLSEKKGFLKYKGDLKTESGQIAATGSMTAYFMQESEQEGDSATKKTIELPSQKDVIPLNKSTYPKQVDMVIANTISVLSDSSCIVNYTYPTDHPLNKGHFPGNPVMMGVMQWMSVADALTAFLEAQEKDGECRISCNAVIANQDNVVIAEFKKVECKAWINVDGIGNQADIIKTNRIVFRSMVKPGDTLSIWATDITIS